MSLSIEPLQDADVPALIELARGIWTAHYPSIITIEQIEYMLDQRYTPAVILEQLHTPGFWWHVMRRDGRMLGFSACERSDKPGQMKLDKLYVHQDHHGQGLGSRLLAHAEALARGEGCHTLYLQVNKHNDKAVSSYRRNGFTVRESAVFAIGRGFVMDDFVMEKRLA